MADLILLQIDDLEPVRCIDLNDAEMKINEHGSIKDKAIVSWTPQGGGPVSNLKYSVDDGFWVAHQKSENQ